MSQETKTILTPSDLLAYCRAHNFAAELVPLSDHVATVPEAAAAMSCEVEQIGKSILFLIKGGEPILIVASGVAQVRYKLLAQYLGVGRKKLRLAKPDQVIDILGYEVGTVPPLGHRNQVRTLIESSVMEQEIIFAGGGGLYELLRFSPADLLALIGAEVVPLTYKTSDES